MIFTSFVINILQTNGISYITATIIDSIHKNNKYLVIHYFKYFVVISILYIICNSFFKYFQNKLLSNLRQWLRLQLVKILLLINNENFSETNFTKLYSPINRVSYVCSMLFNDIIAYLLPNIAFLFIISIYFLYKDAVLGTGFIIGNIFLILYLLYNWNDMLFHIEESEKYVIETESYLQEILNNIDKIIYRGQTANEIDVFSNKTTNSKNKVFAFFSNSNYHATIMYIIVFIIIFLSIGYLIFLYFKKKVDLTIFITFFTIILLYRDKMINVIQQVPDFIEFIGRTESLLTHFKNMDSAFDILKNTTYKELELDFKHIQFENVCFSYDKKNSSAADVPELSRSLQIHDKNVFNNFNIKLDTYNKIIGITGLSGNGKSTFVKLILKLYKCEKGAIYIDDHNIENVDPDYIRKNMTYVNQTSKLFDKKVVDNMLYGCNDIDVCNAHLKEIMKYDKVKELYRKIDIYNKQSGAMGENLSGGQRQIINIIGGLINPSKILILDEPTNALDPELKREILEIIIDFRKYKQCIIIITHDRDVYPLFDETIHI